MHQSDRVYQSMASRIYYQQRKDSGNCMSKGNDVAL
ncbi:hypothetical protein Goshw_008788 [Gossypium schwendimanii]|uniref:Uncharacterized protein n=1 Tax=Gossypium schwendimanii TaxID=34291 RepID=A0A7J9N3Y2_GOSSC|nr:hypothetical protein [Gossypium schwendimanii]